MSAWERPSNAGEEGASDRAVGAFLGSLPSDTPVYCYNGQCTLDNLIPSLPLLEDFTVVVKNLPPTKFDELEECFPGRIEYSTTLEIIIITMASLPHEQATRAFEGLLSILAHNMRVNRNIIRMGSTRIDFPDRKKEADCSWAPARQGRQFPTVALEAGYSETAAKLQSDMEQWIQDSRGQVKMGITVDIKRGSDNIEIKSWVPVQLQPPLKVCITASQRQVVDRRINQRPTLQVTQRILIKREANGNHRVEGGNLVIPFETLMLAAPGEGEGDFIFTTEMLLEDMAELVWVTIDQIKGRTR